MEPADLGCDGLPDAALRRGIRQFNRGEFFECHETLEALWLAEPGPRRALYQGILQVGVAFHHLRRGNYRGATYLLDSGLRYLAPFPAVCLGVDVAALRTAAERCQHALAALGPARIGEFDHALTPRIRLHRAPRPPRPK